MSTEPENTPNQPTDQPPSPYEGPRRVAFLVAMVGLTAFILLSALRLTLIGTDDPAQFFRSYLVGFVFWVAFPIGAMVLLMIQYLTKGRWGIYTRRVMEAHSRCFWLMALLFIPVAIGAVWEGNPLYWWGHSVEHIEAHAENETHAEDLLASRARFNNPAMFIGCSIGYLAFYSILALLLNRWSKKSDQDPDAIERYWLKNISGPGLMLHALILTAVATHWVMSLQPGWASTMFPVIFNINTILCAWASGIIMVLWLSEREPIKSIIQPIDKINMGSFLLAFTLFWSYVSFSQFMLIWVANLPEEIPFYLKRAGGGWEWVSRALMVFHFALPFLLLLFRDIKLHPRRLQWVAAGLLVICAVDVFWWIEPTESHEGHPLFWTLDIAALAAIGGVYVWWFLGQMPTGDDLLPKHEKHLLVEGHDEHH